MKTLCLLLLFAAIADPPVPASAEWQGQETVENGKTIVRNPESPVEEIAIEMRELWRRGDEDDDIFFGMPVQVLEGAGGDVYVLDSQISEIHVFSRDGEHLRTIGREGDGPGEFRNANDMFVRPDGIIGVVVVFPGKIVQLRPDGTPAERFPYPGDSTEGFQLIYSGRAAGDRVVISGGKQSRSGGRNEQENYLKALDLEGNELAHFHSMSEFSQYGGMEFDEKVFSSFKGQFAAAADGRVAADLGFDDYRIHVWNPDGTLDRIVERPDYVPVERSDREKQRFQKLYDGITSWNPNSTFEISDTHRAIVSLHYRPDGSLWVLSGRGVWATGPDAFAAFDVYDRDGRFVNRVVFEGPGDPTDDGIFFGNGRIYRVTDQFGAVLANFGGGGDTVGDDEAEPLQIVAYDIDLPELGANR